MSANSLFPEPVGRTYSSHAQVTSSSASLFFFPRVACFLLLFLSPALTARPADEPAPLLKRTFESAKAALATGDFAEAERRYRRTIAIGLRQLANLSVSESRFDEAIRDLDDAMKFAPDDLDLAVDAAVASFRGGDVKKARQLAQSVLAVNPNHNRAQNVLGRIELYRGDFDAAATNLQASVSRDGDFETSYFLGIAYLKAKRLPEAQQLFARMQGGTGDSAAFHVLIGRAYLIAHYPESAVKELRKAVQLDPKYPHAHGLLGYSILEFRGEEAYPDARLEFERELKIHPDDYNALLLLGISAVALRDFPAAETALLHAKRLRPEEPFAYMSLGEIYSETKRLQMAVDALEKYIQRVPEPEQTPRDVSRAYYLLGQALRRLGRLEEAQKALVNSQRFREAKFRDDAKHIFDAPAPPSDGDSHTSDRIAGLLESSATDEQKNAKALVHGGVQENPSSVADRAAQRSAESKAAKEYRAFASEILARSYNDLGTISARAANFSDATGYFKQAAGWNPSLPGIDRNWGLAGYRAQLYQEAIPPLERQLARSPGDTLVRQLLGMSYYLTENFAKTTEVLRPFLSNPPDDPGLLLAWGTALVHTQQPDLGERLFRRLLEKNADDPDVHFLLGQAHAQQEDYPAALQEYSLALGRDPHLPEAHYYKGLVYLHQGDLASAETEFRAELEIRPGEVQTTYHLGYTLLSAGSPEKAIPLFQDVLKVKPDFELAYFEIGRALLLQGDVAGAIDNLENATKLNPEHDAAFFQLSQAYRRAGQAEQAQQALGTYQRLIETSRSKKRQSLEAPSPQ